MIEAPARPIDHIVVHSALNDGTRVSLRCITPADEERLRTGIATLSAESRYLRFFSPAPTLPDAVIKRLVDVDGHDHIGWGAICTDCDDWPAIGAVHAVRYADGPAGEFSIAVLDAFQGKGLARMMTAALLIQCLAEDLLTLRAQRVMMEADVIVYDALVPQAIVDMGRRDAERLSVGKRKGCHSKSQEEINDLLVELGREGKRVVRLKSGDPLVFGRAGEEMAALRDAGIAYEVVPGVTAAFAAAADFELPLTLRGVSSSMVFTTGHDLKGNSLPDWAKLAISGATVATFTLASTTLADAASYTVTITNGVGAATSAPVALTVAPQEPFFAWASASGLPANQRGATDNPDADDLPNLLEFVLGTDPLVPDASTNLALQIGNFAGAEYPFITYTRRRELGGILVNVIVTNDLNPAHDLGAVEMSATPRDEDLDTVVVRSSQAMTAQPRQFFQLQARLP